MEKITKHCDVCENIINEGNYTLKRQYVSTGRYTEHHFCYICAIRINKCYPEITKN
jgi:hypothetical protein